MAEQLLGVMREVAAGSLDMARVKSSLFEEDEDLRTVAGASGNDAASYRDLPALKLDPQDPVASVILAAATVGDPEKRQTLFERALTTYPESVELQLRLVDELVATGSYPDAETQIDVVKGGWAA
ncbi:MAG: tetratricopeptide repeat protein [Dehalococcoidia bacterium]